MTRFARHVGFTSSIRNEDRQQLTKKIGKNGEATRLHRQAPGGLSRWSTKHSMEWQPGEPKLVAEVQFDHFTGGRFRHGTNSCGGDPKRIPSNAL